jgi:hypothetical protein
VTQRKIHIDQSNESNASAMTGGLKTIGSLLGDDAADPTNPLAERAPRRAKHVVTLSWSWSPMHCRYSQYRLAADKDANSWNLYEVIIDDSTGKRISARVATGAPCRGVSAEEAAYCLLKAAWQSEGDLWEFDPAGWEVDESGLLSDEDIQSLEQDLAWSARVYWLREQSSTSLEMLRAQLPDEPDDEIVETLEEISCCIDQLGLPQDFQELCSHFELRQSHLISLACILVKEAAQLSESRKQTAKANLENLKEQI